MRTNPAEIFVFGKVPPQAVDLEELVIGAVLLESHVYLEISDLISAKCFYKESHQLIWKAVEDLDRSGKPIDLLTVTEKLRSNNQLELVGGSYELTLISSKLSSVAHVRTHAAIVYEKYIGRQIIDKGTEIVKKAYDLSTDLMELSEKSVVDFQNIISDIPTNNLTTDNDLMEETQTFIEKVFNKEIPAGLKTAIHSIDFQLGGLRNGELIILAARPSMGKSSLMVQIALNLQAQNYPTAIYSYEMSKEQLMHKILANKCEVDSECITNGNLNRTDYEKIKAFRRNPTPIYISDKTISIDALFNQCLKLKGKIRCLFVDYLQLITVSSDVVRSMGMNREQQVGYISKTLKRIAKEVNIPVIALAQLSRTAATESSKIPELHHLRESGSIEQDADVVLFPHRPEYYGQMTDENGEDTTGLCLIACKKNRNGKTFLAKTKFINKYSMFTDLEQENYQYTTHLTPIKNENEPPF